METRSANPGDGLLGAIGLVGSAPMVSGIAQVLAEAGLPVRVWGSDAAACEASIAFALQMIQRKVAKGTLSSAQAASACEAMAAAQSLEDLHDCDLVIESLLSTPTATRDLIARLEAVLRTDALIALNTSSHPVTVLARDAQHPRRIAGLHFFEPVPLMRIVEVIPGLRTAPAVVSALTALMRRIGHQAVVVKDFPGFVVNHIGRAVLTEGLRIVSEQIAPVGVIDRIVRHSLGLRMGPFELLDLIGLDVSQPVTEQIYQDFQHEPRLRPTPLLLLQVAAGLLGRKTRQGFYRHSADGLDVPDTPAIAAASLPPGISLPPLWIDRSDAVLHGRIRDHVSSTGTVFDDGDVAHAASLCVIAPVGEDATTAALRLGLDPSRTVAVDALSGLAPQATLMAAPTFEPALRQAALAIFARAGQVDWIEDSPGFVAQRTLAMIVNTACDVAQQGMARPADIDTAIQLALGYPSGPLALGDQAGAARVLQILDAMHRFYGDARYRASPWLRRRAALGVPLGTLSDTALPIAQAA